MSDMSDYLPMFVNEAGEQLDDLVDVLLVLEREPDSAEELNEAFRLIHSIKGAAGMMGFDNIALLTHHLESYFETLRSGLARLDEQRMNLVLRCTDFLRDCIMRLGAGEPLGKAGDLLAELAALSTESGESAASSKHRPTVVETPSTAPGEARAGLPDEATASTVHVPQLNAASDFSGYLLTVRFETGLPLPDLKARLIIARISQLGAIALTQPTEDELEALEHLSRFDVLFTSEQPIDVIRSAVDLAGIESLDLTDRATQLPALEVDAVAAQEVDEPEEDSAYEDPPTEHRPEEDAAEGASATGVQSGALVNGESLIEFPATVSPEAETQPAAQTSRGRSRATSSETMRVDIDRLDNLLNLTGELVVGRARLAQVAADVAAGLQKQSVLNSARDLEHALSHTLEVIEAQGENIELKRCVEDLRAALSFATEQDELSADISRGFAQITESIDQLTRISDGLQHSVLETRMVPVGPLFSRFRRVVRDLANECGKKVDLDVRGEKTELDKRMIDELGDPLIHLIRNSIDHGLESPETRLQRGKSERGTIFLEASHSGNHVFLSIRDDGGGIDVSRIRSRLEERGILDRTAVEDLSRNELLDYIWHPGFSTAEEVTDISGRGVGLDAVRARIGDLNGSIEVESIAEEGTTFRVRLPLTLAIINCLLVRVRDVIFSLPIENVREIVNVPAESVVTLQHRRTIDVRGEFIPLIRIEDVFDWHAYQDTKTDSIPENGSGGGVELDAVILRLGERVLALRVDELLSNQDIVIKSLSENFVPIRGLSGASILGDGTVCLMLDIASMIELARESKANEPVAGHAG